MYKTQFQPLLDEEKLLILRVDRPFPRVDGALDGDVLSFLLGDRDLFPQLRRRDGVLDEEKLLILRVDGRLLRMAGVLDGDVPQLRIFWSVFCFLPEDGDLFPKLLRRGGELVLRCGRVPKTLKPRLLISTWRSSQKFTAFQDGSVCKIGPQSCDSSVVRKKLLLHAVFC